jgi:predicted transcriptional regulator
LRPPLGGHVIRSTSIEVYNQIEREGLLSRKRFEVYQKLFHSGPLTQSETTVKLNGKQTTVTPRFAELESLGAIHPVGEKICGVTGRKVLLWDVTDRVPMKFEKQKPQTIWIEMDMFGTVLQFSREPREGWIEFRERRKK